MLRNDKKAEEKMRKELAELRQRCLELGSKEAALERTEADLKRSEERLRILFEHAPDAYYLSDLHGVFVDGNRAAEEASGYKRDELIGKNFLKLNLLPWDQIPKAVARLGQNAMGRSTGPDVFTLRRKDGSQAIVEIRTHPVRIGDRVFVLGIARDITNYKRLERELREREQRYALAVNAGKVGVWDWNLETNEIYLDPVLKKMLGFEDVEIKNDIDDWSKRVHPDDAERVMAEATAHLEGRTPQYEIEHRMLCKDGSVRWYLARGLAIRDQYRKPHRMVGTDTDITELKEMQQDLRTAPDDLERRVAERTAELIKTNERLESEVLKRKQVEKEKIELTDELQNALAELKMFRGILPHCSICKKVRNDEGYWKQVDVYIRQHSEAKISHDVCPDCAKKHYSDHMSSK